jgi:hypothetical protein
MISDQVHRYKNTKTNEQEPMYKNQALQSCSNFLIIVIW